MRPSGLVVAWSARLLVKACAFKLIGHLLSQLEFDIIKSCKKCRAPALSVN